MVAVPFAMESYVSSSLPVAAQRCVNMYLEMQPPQEAKSQTPLFGVPGMDAFSTCGVGPIRGLHTMSGVLYAVSGIELYSVSSSGTALLLGSGILGSNVVAMSDNGLQLIIVTGAAGWLYNDPGNAKNATVQLAYTGQPANNDTVTIHGKVYTFQTVLTNVDGHVFIGANADASFENLVSAVTLTGTPGTDYAAATTLNTTVTATGTVSPITFTAKVKSYASNFWTISTTIAAALLSSGTFSGGVSSGLVQIDSDAFYAADSVEFFDDYFVLNRSGTNQFFISQILDGYHYNGLDFASAEASPNNVVGIVQNLQLLFIFSTDHFEVWYDAGSADFPFQRYAGGVITRGCIATHSILNFDNSIFFLGDDKVFYRLEGNVPVRVSSHAIEQIVLEDPDPSQAITMGMNFRGHKFVITTLPASNRTIVYDTASKRWHEKESWNENNVSLFRWRGNCIAEAYGKTYVGDAFDGVVSEINGDVFTERGNTIRALVHSIPYHADRKRVFIPRLELDFETGVGLTDGQGSDPQVMLRFSKDGGRTWSGLQPWRSLGKIGEYRKRLRWLRMGQSRSWVFEVTITDPVKRTLIAANMDIEQGM